LIKVPSLLISPCQQFQFDRVAFSNNQCEHLSVGVDGIQATVSPDGGSIAAIGNHVRARLHYFSFDFHDNERTVFMGNVVLGDVLRYPHPVPSPPDSFNILG
jgi:hypothetical protein